MKKDGRGQASVFEGNDFQKLIDSTPGENHKMIFQLSYWTAARVGEVRRLPTRSVYDHKGKVLPMISFWSEITKNEENRQVPVSRVLRLILEKYWVVVFPQTFYLFPGKEKMEAIQSQSVDHAFRTAVERAGLSGKGYSLHSMRRTAITRMNAAGIAVPVIRRISGHKSLSSLQLYIEVSDEQTKGAIDTL